MILPAKSTLVFAPHHDDESIGCGGTIASLTHQGCDVDLAVVTAGRMGVQDVSAAESMRIREEETRVAAEILGIRQVIFMRLPDHALVFEQETRDRFIEVIRRLSPQQVLMPHEGEMDRDHRLVNELAREAIWLASNPTCLPELQHVRHNIDRWFYEVWTPLVRPTLAVPIDNTWSIKESAIRAYKTQMDASNYVAMAQGLNMFRAVQKFTGAKYAEVFKQI